jgi:hypothetical protein
MDIQLNFINKSNDKNASSIVIFQKNVATDFEELAIAWRVIQHCGVGDNHPFTFPMTMNVSCRDAWGNYTAPKAAENGDVFTLQRMPSGDLLNRTSSSLSGTEVQVINGLDRGAMNASIFKDGKMLATKTTIAPQQKAVFLFNPTIWVGVVSQVVEGQVMSSAIMSDINTEFSLMGLASADIVMRGGGPGTGSEALKFTLENTVMG